MDDIIQALMDIETRSLNMLDDAAAKQKSISEEYENKLLQFTDSKKKESEDIIASLRKELEEKQNKTLSDIKSENERKLELIKQIYEKHHTKIARDIFDSITR